MHRNGNHLALILALFSPFAFGEASTCYGTTSNGRLEHGAQLPAEGKNYVGYSTVARLAGRTYVHSEVWEIVVEAYAALEKAYPDKVFKYAETGFEEGGEFKPHRTHRNGLSVDFMTPVITADGRSVQLPTHPFNKFGYNIEFDAAGRYGELAIDYEALATHLVALHKAAKARGHELWRVVFDPELQPGLFGTRYGNYLKTNIHFSERRAWVMHDEHYHVDFEIPCR